ncbi:MAG: hypothetical protein ABIE68_04720 [bacterium]
MASPRLMNLRGDIIQPQQEVDVLYAIDGMKGLELITFSGKVNSISQLLVIVDVDVATDGLLRSKIISVPPWCILIKKPSIKNQWESF